MIRHVLREDRASTQYGRTIGYAYGPASQGFARTMAWPGAAGTLLTCTDALGRVSRIKEAADCATAAAQFAAICNGLPSSAASIFASYP